MFVKEFIKKHFGDAQEIKMFHRGYVANSYVFRVGDKKYFLKKIKIKPRVNLLSKGLTSKKVFEREVGALRRLQKFNTKEVFVPDIVFLDSENLIYVQKFYKFIPFNKYLLKSLKNQKIKKSIEELATFLAEYHSKYLVDIHNGDPFGYIHGDLNNKNIGFTDNGKLIIIDPGFRDYEYRNSVYFELARVLLNFFPYHPYFNFKLPKKFKFELAKIFIDTYIRKSTLDISCKKILDTAISLNRFFRFTIVKPEKSLKIMIMCLIGKKINSDLLELKLCKTFQG